MAKDKDISGGHGPTSGFFINLLLRDSFTAEMSVSKSSRHLNNIIIKKSRKVNIIKIKIAKKLLKNIKK